MPLQANWERLTEHPRIFYPAHLKQSLPAYNFNTGSDELPRSRGVSESYGLYENLNVGIC